ncbi:tetratricopeptide repeat protein 39B-like [Chelonus insularis]|uniref:tetratricopeptide repeat protein 39B-like n=1 Tax=Chelonus insularis TaxID=460826 RepID=UPI00158A4C5F|nr:tetratricopeptide repeat protein 39B-like [Chelonus insularis]
MSKVEVSAVGDVYNDNKGIEEEEDDDEVFEDAQDISPSLILSPQELRPDNISPTYRMDLRTAINEAKTASHYFFNNEYGRAKKILEPWAESSMYHSLGNSVFACLEAFLTFEQKHIEKASEALRICMNVCSKNRRHITLTQNIGKMVKKTNYNTYTVEEVHAELCYAESLLLKAILTFVEDETLVSFVKAGLKIRTCYLMYKECLLILKSRKWENETDRVHFESGVRMGIGTFNLMISLLPGRVIKLLEFIGFSGDKNFGLEELKKGYEDRRGIRHVLCAMTLLSYHLITSFIISLDRDGDLEWSEKALQIELQHYPDGVWFLFFKGRLEFIKGNIEKSVEWYKKSWKSQDTWPQFHHLCFWELMWANCCQQKWDDALFFSNCLVQESNWSRTIYYYQQAAIMMMKKIHGNKDDDKNNEDNNYDDINNLMLKVPAFKQRIAGKSVPMEKFVVKKSERYFLQNHNLILPIFELEFVWNLFRIVGKRSDLIINMFKVIEKEEKRLKNFSSNIPEDYQTDNLALLLLLKGACLRQMKHYLQAEDCLNRVVQLEKQIKEDIYLVPYAIVELAVLNRDRGNIHRAVTLLEDAKKNYTGYSLESRLHFRIHSELMELEYQIKSAAKAGNKGSSNKQIDLINSTSEVETATEAIFHN